MKQVKPWQKGVRANVLSFCTNPAIKEYFMSRGKGGNRRIYTIADKHRDEHAALIARCNAPFAMRPNVVVTDEMRERNGYVRAYVADGSGAHTAWVERVSC